MKKTVFLFLLAITALLNLTNGVLGVEISYELEDYEIIINNFKENGITGFKVEKTGVNPFSATVIDNYEHYFVTGVEKLAGCNCLTIASYEPVVARIPWRVPS